MTVITILHRLTRIMTEFACRFASLFQFRLEQCSYFSWLLVLCTQTRFFGASSFIDCNVEASEASYTWYYGTACLF